LTIYSFELAAEKQMALVKADSIGDAADLLDSTKLGFDLPTNDSSKAGKLDQMSVDSYWVDDEHIQKINELKKVDPVKPDYQQVSEYQSIKQSQNLPEQSGKT
jgi:hypothetical protein